MELVLGVLGVTYLCGFAHWVMVHLLPFVEFGMNITGFVVSSLFHLLPLPQHTPTLIILNRLMIISFIISGEDIVVRVMKS